VRLVDDLIESVARLDCPVRRVCIGLHWTVVESRYVGISHTFARPGNAEPESSGDLISRSAAELACNMRKWSSIDATLGLAALNSLIEPVGERGNVFERIIGLIPGKTVTVVGRFPFNDQIKEAAGRAYFLEMDPQEGELPPQACEEVIPLSDFAMISATALINKTLPRLLEIARGRTVIVLGPSTPLNDVLFRHGAGIIGGVRTLDPDALFAAVAQGAKKFGKLPGVEPVTKDASS
jgi:uncharacterized protein (DUF4213/DUF364 family)